MASFTVRVMLPGNPAEDQYVKLHEAMRRESFTRTITSNDGIEYHLPHAEYNISNGFNRSEVLNKAKTAANGISSKAEILVTESSGRTWSNLKPVK